MHQAACGLLQYADKAFDLRDSYTPKGLAFNTEVLYPLSCCGT